MATRVELLALGQSMEEGTITVWHKAEGDQVTKGEPLYNVMTDKADFEQEAPDSGILRKILVPADDIASVGALLAVIAAADEPIDAALGGAQAAPSAAPVAEAVQAAVAAPAVAASGAAGTDGDRIFASPRARRVADENGIEIAQLVGRATGIDGRIVEADVLAFVDELTAAKKTGKVTPLAQKVAADTGVDLSSLTGSGSGHGGKVTSDDVRKVATPAPIAVAPAKSTPGEDILKVIPLTGMRKMIADNVAKSSSTAPHVTLTIGVDMFEATRFRKQVLASVEKAKGVRISFTDIIATATAKALTEHPVINSTLVDGKINQYRPVHLGIAVSLGEGGLVVPTIRNAENLTLSEVSAAIKSQAAKARDGKLGLDEMTGGTFSITNLGTYGVQNFNPIINPPQCAILGVCTITDTIVPIDGAPQVRPIMNLCLSFDHRITDGAPAAAFLARLKEILETPYLIFI